MTLLENHVQECEAAKEKLRKMYEVSYAEFVKKFPKLPSIFWRDKDNIRYFNEILDGMDIENRKTITYPNVIDRTLLILSLIASFYNSGPKPDADIYGILIGFSLSFLFYIMIGELLQMCNGNRSPLEIQQYCEYLE
ncbi:hypothetical protein CAEBREN_00064 [Caenorhabditis brenneri]|uniref:Uncharacterized protein n=1 Tax=Caenorhabditis brenneri TaxID=135651 RepID=G0NMG2_CAEBE|nr:hypothetical protein CAEBREN_00064 [Caenorhabditis brenneri]